MYLDDLSFLSTITHLTIPLLDEFSACIVVFHSLISHSPALSHLTLYPNTLLELTFLAPLLGGIPTNLSSLTLEFIRLSPRARLGHHLQTTLLELLHQPVLHNLKSFTLVAGRYFDFDNFEGGELLVQKLKENGTSLFSYRNIGQGSRGESEGEGIDRQGVPEKEFYE